MLYGNSPRFSWVPSSTMLLNRLMALQSLRCLSGPNDSNSTEQGRFWRMTDQANGARTIFCPHGEPATGPTLLLTPSSRASSRARKRDRSSFGSLAFAG